jgi:hypothetical protein
MTASVVCMTGVMTHFIPIAVAFSAIFAGLSAADVTFVEDQSTVLLNPERGWFRSIEPNYATNEPAPAISGSVIAGYRTNEGHTLIRKYYLLRPWIAQDLPQTVLDMVAADLATCRAQGFKLIARFTYNFNQTFGSEDATQAWTVRHIQQLGAVFTAAPGAIDHVHAGFIGKWGEMHSSTNGHVLPGTTTLSASGHAIVDALIASFPPSRMIGLRYPTFKMAMYPDPLPLASAYAGDKRARLGAYNQGILYDGTDYGTFSTNAAQQAAQRAYWTADCDRTFMSGEPAGATATTWQDPVPVLAAQRFASLHSNQYDAKTDGVYDWWKANGPIGDTYFDQLTRRLGYRFVLTTATVPATMVPGAPAALRLAARNDGFAALHNPRGFRLFLVSGAASVDLVLDQMPDPRQWRPASTTTLNLSATVPAGTAAGTWDLHLALPDPDAALASDVRFAIRCANAGIWDAARGSHRLGSLTVSAQTGPQISAPAAAAPPLLALP